VNINIFLDIFIKKDITFFTGVPDSLLSVFCDEIVNRYGVGNKHHIVAHNEGGGVALASGYHLSTGKIPCVYMQNSGIGNALNPVASLTHPKVYGIPMLFVVGWRGEPGIPDEPQHIFQGEVTLALLSDMDIDCFIVDKETSAEQVESVLTRFNELFNQGMSAAFVIRKGAFSGNGRVYENEYKLNREQAVGIVLEAAGSDPVVSTTGKISRELFEIRNSRAEGHERDFLTVGSMGHSVMIALGIALQQPERRVWCLDGDGAVLMHMGGMGIVASQAPERFIHVVFNNSAHETVGGIPTVAGTVDLSAIALACGYRHIYKTDDVKTLKEALEQAKIQNGPIFIEVFVTLGSRSELGRPTTSTKENKCSFMEFLRKR
jgi:phosphonopyruvate decarboxylase